MEGNLFISGICCTVLALEASPRKPRFFIFAMSDDPLQILFCRSHCNLLIFQLFDLVCVGGPLLFPTNSLNSGRGGLDPNPRKHSFIASHLRRKEGFSSVYPWRRKSVNYNPPTARSTTRIETIWVKLKLDKLHLFRFPILHVAHALSLNPSYWLYSSVNGD
jgi:hypothetical protein